MFKISKSHQNLQHDSKKDILEQLKEKLYKTISTLHLNAHSEKIVTQFSDQIDNLRTDLMDHISNLEKKWNEQLTMQEQLVNDLVRLVEIIEEQSKELEINNPNEEQLIDLAKRCDSLERRELVPDAILFVMPELPNENLIALFNQLCFTIDYQVPTSNPVFDISLQQTRWL